MNILVTSLSIFSVGSSDGFIHKSTYTDIDGNPLGTAYHSGVPVCKMLVDRLAENGEKLDKIMTVTTDLVEKTDERTFYDDEKKCKSDVEQFSALSYYKSIISSYIEEKTGESFSGFASRSYNISSLTEAASALADEIEKSTHGETAPVVYIDATGGFRDNIIVIISIMHILSARGIFIRDIYGTEYNNANRSGKIVSRTKNYSYIYFVSGVDEFLKYGRASLLTAFFENADSSAKKILKIIENLATGIQFCNMNMFAPNVRKLKDEIPKYLNSETAEPLFSYLLKKIADDYDILLKNEMSAVIVARWCVRKEFFQQSLTFLESQLPKDFVSKQIIGTSDEIQKIMECSENERLIMNSEGKLEPNKKVRNSWKAKENYLIDEYLGRYEIIKRINNFELHPVCQNETAIKAVEVYFDKVKKKRNEMNHADSDFSRKVFLDSFIEPVFKQLEEAKL